ncbi:hypothetical protein RYZ26_17180 [Terasakiella sp. A23]|uniref:hypothetical protein n=1 Tax=Terasakiella sp. FCG-A23 TaxID=3080561 RepID=UPI0029548B4F|nr:hypothetical protein [Terasakiella sp. A23]MDV7341345.1 hypothetical protein [Terasakiella sp. A23]
MTNNVDKRLQDALQKKRKAVMNLKRIQQQVSKEQRAKDTQKKVLLGFCVLEAMKYDENLKRYMGKLLDKHLTRDRDRKVFDLEPLNGNEPQNGVAQ